MDSSRAVTVPELLLIIAVLVVLGALLFPAVPFCGPSPKSAQAKNDVVQIATAVTAYKTEYGQHPGTNPGPVGKDLVEILLGNNETLNPRKIVFIEIANAKKGKSGLSNGTFVDPWGGPYQIAFDSDSDGNVTAGTNNVVVPKNVAVWNDPRLEKVEQGWFFFKKPKSRYVTSWE